jgi:hypothetical protein
MSPEERLEILKRALDLDLDIKSLDAEINKYEALYENLCGKRWFHPHELAGFATLDELSLEIDKLIETRNSKANQQQALDECLTEHQNKNAASPKLVWTGTRRELADWILTGKLKTSSELNALEQAAAHFEIEGGGKLTGRNLQQNIKRRAEEGK